MREGRDTGGVESRVGDEIPRLVRLVALSCLPLGHPVDCSHQAPLSLGFSRREHWSGLPFPSPEDLPHPGIEPRSPVSLALAAGFFTPEPPGKPALLMGFPGGSDGKEPASSAEDPGTSNC